MANPSMLCSVLLEGCVLRGWNRLILCVLQEGSVSVRKSGKCEIDKVRSKHYLEPRLR